MKCHFFLWRGNALFAQRLSTVDFGQILWKITLARSNYNYFPVVNAKKTRKLASNKVENITLESNVSQTN